MRLCGGVGGKQPSRSTEAAEESLAAGLRWFRTSPGCFLRKTRAAGAPAARGATVRPRVKAQRAEPKPTSWRRRNLQLEKMEGARFRCLPGRGAMLRRWRDGFFHRVCVSLHSPQRHSGAWLRAACVRGLLRVLVQEPSERGCLPLMFSPPAWLMSFPASFQEHDGNRKEDANGGAKFCTRRLETAKALPVSLGGGGRVTNE